MICEKKKTYSNRKKALSAASVNFSENGGIKLNAYKCPKCKKWHHTKKKYQYT